MGRDANETGVNVKSVLRIAGLYCLIWLAFMLVPTLAGQPEAICLTPFGLILAMVAGLGVMAGPRGRVTRLSPWNLTEAALAGALVGTFQGALLGIWMPFLMAQREGTTIGESFSSMPALLPAALALGTVLGAVLGIAGYAIRSIGTELRR
jgi:hypothetical protein